MYTSPIRLLFFIICFSCLTINANTYADLPKVRVGVLKYGTVNWEIAVIKHYQLDKKYNFNLQVMPLSNKNASAVALQSKAVDIILSDWLWVNRQRFNDKNYTLVPTSIASGGLYVAGDSTAKSLNDLTQTKIGVAGGSVDKNWLLLQSYAQKKYQLNIKDSAEMVFATPPLLNRLMERDAVDAAINFWHYNARLSANGFKLLVSVPEMLAELGITNKVPLLGWVFEQAWAIEHKQKLTSFLQASKEAQQLLLYCDDEWQRIRPLIKAENDKVFLALKNEYRIRLLDKFGPEEIKASKQIFSVLAEQGGRNLVGKATILAEGTFWKTNKVNPSFDKKIADDLIGHQITCPLK
ncbi:ABC transporter substrate-binding protein [Candidatus Colwellia aromaticivorans]|uniref:ABC transporter substrate-binding protein n=1 Tax=Candidatus Colwellia aromaticivorans TaxID=2267621 RepID=UPI001B347989|nr:ABC transporter substrate-binding protein [Candidatus Colwellia aromaticivorans]